MKCLLNVGKLNYEKVTCQNCSKGISIILIYILIDDVDAYNYTAKENNFAENLRRCSL